MANSKSDVVNAYIGKTEVAKTISMGLEPRKETKEWIEKDELVEKSHSFIYEKDTILSDLVKPYLCSKVFDGLNKLDVDWANAAAIYGKALDDAIAKKDSRWGEWNEEENLIKNSISKQIKETANFGENSKFGEFADELCNLDPSGEGFERQSAFEAQKMLKNIRQGNKITLLKGPFDSLKKQFGGTRLGNGIVADRVVDNFKKCINNSRKLKRLAFEDEKGDLVEKVDPCKYAEFLSLKGRDEYNKNIQTLQRYAEGRSINLQFLDKIPLAPQIEGLISAEFKDDKDVEQALRLLSDQFGEKGDLRAGLLGLAHDVEANREDYEISGGRAQRVADLFCTEGKREWGKVVAFDDVVKMMPNKSFAAAVEKRAEYICGRSKKAHDRVSNFDGKGGLRKDDDACQLIEEAFDAAVDLKQGLKYLKKKDSEDAFRLKIDELFLEFDGLFCETRRYVTAKSGSDADGASLVSYGSRSPMGYSANWLNKGENPYALGYRELNGEKSYILILPRRKASAISDRFGKFDCGKEASGSEYMLFNSEVPNKKPTWNRKPFKPTEGQGELRSLIEKEEAWTKSESNRVLKFLRVNFKFSDYEDKIAPEFFSGDYKNKDEVIEAYKKYCRPERKFVPVPAHEIDAAAKDGSVLVFDITCRDFREKSNGRKNANTLMLESIFLKENRENGYFIVPAGNVDLRHREPSELAKSSEVVHKKGSLLVNRTHLDHGKIVSYSQEEYNERKLNRRNLYEEGELGVRKAPHDIRKDKRYLNEQYSVRIPVKFNDGSGEEWNQISLNSEVLKDFCKKAKSDQRIDGIDVGENNLGYFVKIDGFGRILDQHAWNEFNGFDYKNAIDELSEKRKNHQRKWKIVPKIKDLKNGFTSCVVGEMKRDVVSSRSIVALERAPFDEDRFRKNSQKKTYRKIDRGLETSFQYLTLKERLPFEPAGVCRGLQLSLPAGKSNKPKEQNGAIFRVHPEFTSKNDPLTGFLPLFNFKNIEGKEVREFFKGMDRFSFLEGAFVFEFNYLNLPKKYLKNKYNKGKLPDRLWRATTRGKRVLTNWRGQRKEIDPTGKIEELLEKYDSGSDYKRKEGEDLLPWLIRECDDPDLEEILRVFETLMLIRYKDPKETDDRRKDYILSPILAPDSSLFSGRNFDSRNNDFDRCGCKLPKDADANGAYNIALKALYLLEGAKEKNAGNDQWRLPKYDFYGWFAWNVKSCDTRWAREP